MSFVKYIADESHYKEVLSLVGKAKRTVWIGTADSNYSKPDSFEIPESGSGLRVEIPSDGSADRRTQLNLCGIEYCR